jgi:hypothetical protein
VAELSERYANIRDSLLLTGAMLLMISFVVLLAIEGTLITKVILGDVALVLGTILGIGTVAVLASIFKSEIFYNVAQYADFSKYAPYPALAYVDLPYITILITAFVVSGVSTVAGLVGKKAK